ncbi:MAG: peroxiredoxin family protein [Acidimicrobiia bacterium]
MKNVVEPAGLHRGGNASPKPPRPITSQEDRTRPYRIERPRLRDVLGDLRIPAKDLGPGDRPPAFDLPTTDGRRFSSAQFDGNGCPVLLVFGSLSCPVTESAGPGLVELHRRYGNAVRFVLVNVREAHPGELAPQPTSAEIKMRHAVRLRRHHGLPFETAVDDVDGTLHRAFGTRPSSAYLIDADGTIRFRAHWSNVTDALDEALSAIVKGQPIRKAVVGGTMRAMVKMTGHAPAAFASAGRGAMADTWRAAPPFAAMITVAGLLRSLPADRRGLPAMLVLAIAMIGFVAMATAAVVALS